MFIDLNEGTWEAEQAMSAIAAGETRTAAWLKERVRFTDRS